MTQVYLIGFMGAGKTSVGRELAVQLKQPFIDLDEAISSRTGQSIACIFESEGETAFRRYEAETLTLIRGPKVIALGGGTPMQQQLREWMALNGTSLFLHWPFEVLRDRVVGDPTRPLAKKVTTLRTLFDTRLPTYLGADHVWISQPPHLETVPEVVASCVDYLMASPDF